MAYETTYLPVCMTLIVSFPMRSVSYRSKLGNLFFPDLLALLRLPNSFFHSGCFDYKFLRISHEFITRIYCSLDRLCGLVVRVPGYRSRGPGSISRAARFFRKVVGLERGPLSLVSITEEILERKSSDSGLENREYGRRDLSRWPRATFYSQRVGTTFADRWRSLRRYSIADWGHGVYIVLNNVCPITGTCESRFATSGMRHAARCLLTSTLRHVNQ
jgi:hypothetical protein